jgi:two-component system response regulator AtoC
MRTTVVHVFISYSHHDAAFVGRLKAALQAAGATLWIDHENLPAGHPNWQLAVRESIERADVVIYVASPVAARSKYVIDELNIADDLGRRIIPMWAHGRSWADSVPIGRGTTQYIDAHSTRYTSGIASLLDALGLSIPSGGTESAPPMLLAPSQSSTPATPHSAESKAPTQSDSADTERSISLAAGSSPISHAVDTTAPGAISSTARVAPSGLSAEQRRRILVADDDQDMREILGSILAEAWEPDGHFEVIEAADGQQALDILTSLEDERPSVALLDIDMPGLSGIGVLQRMQDQGINNVPVIILTAMAAGSLTIRAMQLGASDFLSKPFEIDHLIERLILALRKTPGAQEIKRGAGLELAPPSRIDPSARIVGSTPEMLDIFKTIGRIARTSATVLVTGEPGTGKELMAEAIHDASDRRAAPLIKIDCPKSEAIQEIQLFGREKGASSRAPAPSKGGVEQAHKGTIFLDGVERMTLGTQTKLLRVLQEKKLERVGGTIPLNVDVRVIAATTSNLHNEVAAGRFREDLFYNLSVIAFHIPPLRERLDEVPLLVAHFLTKHRYTPTSPPTRIAREAMDKLISHNWPGNVGELENVIQRAIVLSGGSVIAPEDIVFANFY